MTVREARRQGYKEVFSSMFRGYVSRKIDIEEQQVYEGKGRRNGLIYYKKPKYGSTAYSYKVYMKKEN